MAPPGNSVDLKGAKKGKKSNSKNEKRHRKEKHERPAADEASLPNEAKRKHKEHGKKPKNEEKAEAETEAGGYSVGSDIAHYLMARHDDTPMIDKETHRLAVVNMDWDHIKAVDLYMVMTSWVPKGGRVLSVSIYPSEFGLECMNIETTQGPSALLGADEDDGGDGGDDDNSEVEDDDDDDVDGEYDSEHDSETENNRLRAYELNRLSATANHLYMTLDSTEFLKTANVFDLQFIRDSMEFKRAARDVATEAPPSYKEPDSETPALQPSKVKLTWDDDEPDRKILRWKSKEDQIMAELQQLCARPALPQSMEHVEVGSSATPVEGQDSPLSCEQLEAPESIVSVLSVADDVDAVNTLVPNPLEPNQPLAFVERGVADDVDAVNTLVPNPLEPNQPLAFVEREGSDVVVTHSHETVGQVSVRDKLDDPKMFLPSDDSASDDDVDDSGDESLPNGVAKRKLINKERLALLLQGDKSDEEQSDGQGMEITFNMEPEDLSKRILERKSIETKIVWETHQEKMKEKRKARKRSSKDDDDYSDEDSADENDDFFEDEKADEEVRPIKKQKVKTKGKAKDKLPEEHFEPEATKEELELLVAADQDAANGAKGCNIKRRSKKSKGCVEDKLPEIDISTDDLRFSATLTDHLYALDPTDPQYKRAKQTRWNRKRKGEILLDGGPERHVHSRPSRIGVGAVARVGNDVTGLE
uniref:Uncharacterized protein n=1 Tax=Aegilops tauschii TaxID=37682 RepID=N1QXY1_AEGTA